MKMKDSGVEWIGKIPEGWEVKKVKHAFIRKNEKAQQENPIVLSLARTGVKERDISTNEGQLAESYFNYNPVDIGDLLLNPMDLYSGANCSISKIKGVISPAYINLKARENVNPVFYDYYFKVQYWMMAFFAHGNGVSFENRWTLNNETLQNYPIVYPPFETQQKIATYLDEKCSLIEQTIQNQQKIIEKLKAYKQSLITEAVTGKVKIQNGKVAGKYEQYKDSRVEWIGEIPSGWEAVKFKYLGKFIGGYAFPSTEFSDTGIKVIKIANIQPMKVSWEEKSFVTEKYKDLSDYQVCKGDLIFALTRPIINGGIKTAIFDEDDFVLLNQRNAMFKGGKSITSKWQFYLMQHKNFIQEFEKYIDGTGQQPNISTFEIQNIAIPLPEIKEQNEIAEYLDKTCAIIDSAIEQKQKLIEKLTEYKKSLIYECVTGKKDI